MNKNEKKKKKHPSFNLTKNTRRPPWVHVASSSSTISSLLGKAISTKSHIEREA